MIFSQNAGGGVTFTSGDALGQVFTFQPAVTNLLLRSENQANTAGTPYAFNNGLTVPVVNGADPRGGIVACTINDPNAGATATLTQDVAIANDNTQYVASWYVAVGTSIRAKFELLLTGGGVPVDSYIEINPVSGVVVASVGTVAQQVLVIAGVTWYRLSVLAINNTSGNIIARSIVTPASTNAPAVGNVVTFGYQLEVAQIANSAQPGIYIPTTSIAKTVSGGGFPGFLTNNFATALTAAYVATGADNNAYFSLSTGAANLTLPLPASVPVGYRITVDAIPGTVARPVLCGGTDKIFGPGLSTAGTVAVVFNDNNIAGSSNGFGQPNGGEFISLGGAGLGGSWEFRPSSQTHGEVTFTAGANWTCPANVFVISVDGAAAGAGGGGSAATGAGGGGSAGQSTLGQLIVTVPGTVYAIGIGAGGAGGAAGNNNGAVGTNSTLGALLTLLGGNFGAGAAGAGIGGGGATPGAGASNGGVAYTLQGAVLAGGQGGGNQFAPASQPKDSGAGSPGLIYGGGGSGSGSAGGAGGNGANGFLRIRW